MRTYDILLLLSPTATESGPAPILGELRDFFKESAVEMLTDEDWGRRRLAYLIGPHREGVYHHFQLRTEPAVISEYERRMKLSESVLRTIAVRLDDDLKRQAKADKRKKPRRPPEAQNQASSEAESPQSDA